MRCRLTVLLALLVGALAGVATTGPAARAAPLMAAGAHAGGAPRSSARFDVVNGHILDRAGRVLVLRGLNMSGAEYTPTDQPLAYRAADFTAIRAMGATVVRIPIAWALIEPVQGDFDPKALVRVKQIVDWAGAAGLLVVLDMHQYDWSPCYGGNGMPAWATTPCPASVPSVSGVGEEDAAGAEDIFWTTQSLQAQFASAWAATARAVGAPPWLLGYDLLNEPPNGTIAPGVFETAVLAPFDRMVASRLRAVDPGGLIFVEPSYVHGVLNPASSFIDHLDIARVVYAPHAYGSSLDDGAGHVADVLGPAQFAPDLALDQAEARRAGAALWIGEWGSVNPGGTPDYQPFAYTSDMLVEQDHLGIGSAYWEYERGVWPLTPAIRAILTRPEPFAIAGALRSFSTSQHQLTLTWQAAAGQTEVSLPAGARATVRVLAGDVHYRDAGPGWLVLTAPAGTRAQVQIRVGAP
ncbi:MAG: glycoside hydrolase family 5 protein [Acidimicrobiales bacterium]